MLKSIQVDSNLFKPIGGKTRKSRPEKLSNKIPDIQPSQLLINSRLRKRQEQNKKKELSAIHAKTVLPSFDIVIPSPATPAKSELESSMSYLSDLSNKIKIDDEKKQYDLRQKLKHDELRRKTLRSYSPSDINLNLTLPDNNDMTTSISVPITDVSSPQLPSTSIVPAPTSAHPQYSYKVDNDVPHGCMRSGIKPSYKSYQQTRRNLSDNKINFESTQNERKSRLESIRNRIKEREIAQATAAFTETTPDYIAQILENPPKNTLITKKTLKHKYTLGRSKDRSNIAILVPNSQTRKNRTDEYYKLHNESIDNVKKYLRKHGLNKIGSTAPTDILRITYESAVLAGDINNTNTDVLLHNFLENDDEENK